MLGFSSMLYPKLFAFQEVTLRFRYLHHYCQFAIALTASLS
ncbi:hypothetical protein Q7O_003732 [Pectobacterium carotovorum subsp. carotovorum PCCS1]|nr:hypothetical protein [Pectobacterium carotovorum subsp. carotovorum PCCS1]